MAKNDICMDECECDPGNLNMDEVILLNLKTLMNQHANELKELQDSHQQEHRLFQQSKQQMMNELAEKTATLQTNQIQKKETIKNLELTITQILEEIDASLSLAVCRSHEEETVKRFLIEELKASIDELEECLAGNQSDNSELELRLKQQKDLNINLKHTLSSIKKNLTDGSRCPSQLPCPECSRSPPELACKELEVHLKISKLKNLKHQKNTLVTDGYLEEILQKRGQKCHKKDDEVCVERKVSRLEIVKLERD